MTIEQHAQKYPDVWRRFSPRDTLIRYLWYLGTVAVAVWSISKLDIPWFYFLDAHVQAYDLVYRMWPPDLAFLETLVDPLLETIHIALSLIHISEPTRQDTRSRMPSSA